MTRTATRLVMTEPPDEDSDTVESPSLVSGRLALRSVDANVKIRRFCEIPFRFTYGLGLLFTTTLALMGVFWWLIALAGVVILGKLNGVYDEIIQGFMMSLFVNPSSILGTDPSAWSEANIQEQLSFYFDTLPYIMMASPAILLGIAAIIILFTRVTWRAVEDRRILLPIAMVVLGVPYLITGTVVSLFRGTIIGTVWFLPAVSFRLFTDPPEFLTWASAYAPMVLGGALWLWSAIAIILLMWNQKRTFRHLLHLLKRGSRYSLKYLTVHDWLEYLLFLVKLFLFAPLKLMFSVAFGAFFLSGMVALSVDRAQPPLRNPERMLEDVLPFAITHCWFVCCQESDPTGDGADTKNRRLHENDAPTLGFVGFGGFST